MRVREDKAPEDATSSAQIADMYRSQASVKNSAPRDEGDDFEG
jgi:hypothetical protein